MRILIIASGNQGKLIEFNQFLSHLPLKVKAQPKGLKVEETGNTFSENARVKAISIAASTGEWSLADDSGLSVDSLNGAPGVLSSRYANTDVERIAKLLAAMEGISKRRAKFCAALCIAAPNGNLLLEVEGFCEGKITNFPRGKKGFGYDPIFEIAETGRTFAEMTLSEKKKYGHRGHAFNLLEPKLRQLLANS